MTLHPVSVPRKQLADYATIVGRPLVEEIRGVADRLRGKRVLHLSATPFGGGVAEILYSLVPLMTDVGLRCEWQVIHGREEFWSATRTMHNALQGDPRDLGNEQWEIWDRQNEINAAALDGDWDFCVVHDAQAAPVCSMARPRARHWVWQCHTDLSAPNPATLGRLLPFLRAYPDAVFHIAGYVPRGITARPHIVPPAIDPLSPKNMAFSPDDAVYICEQFGIDVDRPLLCQVSRLDPWKDPLGVIDAYRIVKQDRPEVQLALVGSMAADDPDGWDIFNSTVTHAAGDPDIHILNNLNNIGAIEVNAFQSHCDVAIQKSIREGFGLTVSEALWKGKPLIGGKAGGIPLQITDGETGFLVDSPEACAERALRILADPGLGRSLGVAGKETVRRRFLTPRLLRDWLELFDGILSRGVSR